MKKINTKVVKMVVTLMTFLLVGGATLAIKDGLGDPGTGGGTDGTGLT